MTRGTSIAGLGGWLLLVAGCSSAPRVENLMESACGEGLRAAAAEELKDDEGEVVAAAMARALVSELQSGRQHDNDIFVTGPTKIGYTFRIARDGEACALVLDRAAKEPVVVGQAPEKSVKRTRTVPACRCGR